MSTQLGRTFALTFLMSVLGWTHAGLCQEHFLSETAFEKVAAGFSLSKNVPDIGHLTVLGLTLGKHSIEDARKKLGEARVMEPEHHYDPYVCYRPTVEDDGTILTLSFNERGSVHYLTRIQIISASERFRARDSCRKSPLVSKKLSTQSGVRLGLTPEQVKKTWTLPTREKAEYMATGSEYYEEMGSGDEVTCNDTFWTALARFSSTGLTWLEIYEGGELIRAGHCTKEELPQKR